MIVYRNLSLYVTTITVILLLGIFLKKRLLLLFKNFRFFRIVHYAGFAIGGYIIALILSNREVNLFNLINLFLMTLFGFQAAVYLNDLFDFKIDKKVDKRTPLNLSIITKRESVILYMVFNILFLLFALSFNLQIFLIILVVILISSLYSIPKIKIKKIYPLSIFIIALISLLMMVVGFCVVSPIEQFPQRMVILVLVTLSLAFGTKDIRDVEGDRARGVRTLFTILGIKKGKWVNASLILIAYFLTSIILAYPPLLWFSIPCGIATAVASLQKEVKEPIIFSIYIFFGLFILYLIVTKRVLYGY